MNRLFTKSLVLVALVGAITAFASSNAQAAQICTACEYNGPVGTYIGTYDPSSFDAGTFSHTAVPAGTAIDDRWVFDVSPEGLGSISANLTVLSDIDGFSGNLYEAGATTCGDPATPSGCTAVALGNLVASAGSGDAIATGIVNLTAGRYVFQIVGTADEPFGTYTGQLATAPSVPEPALLSLLGLGLVVAARRRRKA